MDKRQLILREIGEDPENSDMSCVFDQLDKYCIDLSSAEASKQLIQNLKPVLIREAIGERPGHRFRDILADTRQQNSLPEIIQLVGSQAVLMSRWFIALTITFLVMGIMLISAFQNDWPKFLVTASPLLGLLTFFYEYRAQLYKVEEMEAVCRYSPAQVAAARILVVLGYNVLLCTAATLLVESSYKFTIWKLILNWLAPLLLILGIALFASLKSGIKGGCATAGAVWIAQITLMDGCSLLYFVLPNLTTVVTDIISMLFGMGLIYYSLSIWQSKERMTQVR